MIYITGDVHSPIKDHWEQKIAGSEFDAAKKYLSILENNGLTATIFVNGETLNNFPNEVKKIQDFDVELGGHTYDNYGKMNLVKSYLRRKRYGCVYGSTSYQRNDIKKTKKAFEDFGLKMKSWRSHAFASNDQTFKLLREVGVKHVSDLFTLKPFEHEGIIHMPINIPVDNNTLAYGKHKPESRNPFSGCTKGRIRKDEWLEIVKKRVTENEKNGVDSIILIHPITMAVLDNFETFENVAKFLSKYKSAKLSEHKL